MQVVRCQRDFCRVQVSQRRRTFGLKYSPSDDLALGIHAILGIPYLVTRVVVLSNPRKLLAYKAIFKCDRKVLATAVATGSLYAASTHPGLPMGRTGQLPKTLQIAIGQPLTLAGFPANRAAVYSPRAVRTKGAR